MKEKTLRPTHAFQIVVLVLLTTRFNGGDALKFLSQPVYSLEVRGAGFIVNCTVDDQGADVTLLGREGLPSDPWITIPPSPGEIVRNGQVFLVMNNTQGLEQYGCKATSGSETVEWPDDMGYVPYIPSSNTIEFRLLVYPKEAFIRTGQDFNLTCESEDLTNTKLEWVKETPNASVEVDRTILVKNFRTDVVRAILVIRNAKLTDSGTYECLVTNPLRSKADRARLEVKEPKAPTIQQKAKAINVTEEHMKMIMCSAVAFPAPSVTWYKEGTKLGMANCSNKEEKSCEKSSYVIDERKGNLSTSSTLKIKRSQFPRDQGEYMCIAENSYGSAELVLNLTVQVPPKLRKMNQIFIKEHNASSMIWCTIERGNPWPLIQWKYQTLPPNCDATCTPEAGKWTDLSGSVWKSRNNGSVLRIPGDEPPAFYLCVARNSAGSDSRLIVVMRRGAEPKLQHVQFAQGSKEFLKVILAPCLLVISLAVVIFVAIYLRRRSTMREYFFSKRGDFQFDPDRSLLEQCNNLPYDEDWEFPEKRLILGEVLGSGAFGQVVKAEAIGMHSFNPRDKSIEAIKLRSKLRGPNKISSLDRNHKKLGNSRTVAVKMLREGAKEREYKDLASELKMLIHIGEHKNIVNLLGACTRGKRLMVIMEYAPHGSLLGLLRANRGIYEARWTKLSSDPSKEWTLADLVIAAYQVGKGLEFLVSKKCVHRDVAARNVLVGQEGDIIVMKIADFGLARDIYKDDLYVKKTSGLLPVKWMAPESLQDREYTEKSDVWSFGILLWEIFTLGGSPYPGLPAHQLLDFLTTKQKRMNQPRGCPTEVYNIMTDCWMQEPGDRPLFSNIVKQLFKIWRSNLEMNADLLAGGSLYLDELVDPNGRLDSLGESGIGLEDQDALLEIVASVDHDAAFESDSVEV